MNQADRLKQGAQTAMAKKPEGGIIEDITRMKAQLGLAMSNAITPEMLVRTAQTEIRKVPKLAHCSRASFYGALFDCAQLGLMPGPLGHVYLIPYGTECTLVIGYKGLLELCYRSPRIESIEAHVVYEGDTFKQVMGLNPDLIHEPCPDPAKRGEITHAYAVARIKDMSIPRFEVMARVDIDGIRKRSASAKGRTSPWDTDFGEMAKKTVLRRLVKTLPITTDIQNQINRDERITHVIERPDGTALLADYAHAADLPEPEEEAEEAQERAGATKTVKGQARKTKEEAAKQPEEPATGKKSEGKGESPTSQKESPERVDEETGEILTDGGMEETKPNLFD